MSITRIPATVVATATGHETPGKVVVVMVDELDRLEAQVQAAATNEGTPVAPPEPWWRHHPDHMKGWEAFGVTGKEPTVRQLGVGYDGKGKPGTDPWGPGEVKLGVAGIEFSTHADSPTSAYLYVVGTERDDVARRWLLADAAWREFGPTLWPKSRRLGGGGRGEV